MADASMGHQSKLSMAAVGTALGSYTEAYEFVAESLQKRLTILETGGIRGTRSHPAERTRDGTYVVQGTIKYHATPAMLDLMLPRILGTAEVADVFALAESLPDFDVLIDRVARRFVYGGCKINRAVFRGEASGLVELVVELIGKSETAFATAFPAIAPPVDPPYVFQEGVLTLLGTVRKMRRFELVIDNHLAARFTNSQSATDVSPADRTVLFRCQTPYTADEMDLYGQNTGAAAAATLVLTNGGYSTSFALAKLQFPDVSPVVSGKQEIFLDLEGTARRSGGTSELVVTHDSTP